jgi:hypothetical protein
VGWGRLQGLDDALPHALGGGAAAVADECRHLTEVGHLGSTPWALAEVELDDLVLLTIDGVEGVGAQELFDLGV